MILINTSEILADLLPEVCYSLDPDTPLYDDELPQAVRHYVKDLILHAFFHTVKRDTFYHGEWVTRLRQDRFLSAVSDRRWVDVDVVDATGTFVLLIEELDYDYRLQR